MDCLGRLKQMGICWTLCTNAVIKTGFRAREMDGWIKAFTIKPDTLSLNPRKEKSLLLQVVF